MNEPIQPKTEEPEIPKMEPSDVDDELATPLADDDFSTTMLLSQTDNEQESQLAVDQINESSDRHPVSDVITSSQYSITQPRTFSCKRPWDSDTNSEIVLHKKCKRDVSTSINHDVEIKPPTENTKDILESEFEILFCIARVSRTTPNNPKLLSISRADQFVDVKSDGSSLNGYAADHSSSSTNSTIGNLDEHFTVPKKVQRDSVMSSSSSSISLPGVPLNQLKCISAIANNILVSRNVYTCATNLVCPKCNYLYPKLSDNIKENKDMFTPMKTGRGKSKSKKKTPSNSNNGCDSNKSLKKTKTNIENIGDETTDIKTEEIQNNDKQANFVSFDIGNKVFAFWVADKLFYPATIIDVEFSKYKIQFMSDLVIKSVNPEGLIHSSALKPGLEIAIFDTVSQECRMGEIVSINDMANENKTYTIDLESEEVTVTFDKLVLNTEKARILQDKCSFKSYDRLTMSNVSEGKRLCSSRSNNSKYINAKKRNDSIKRKKIINESNKKQKCLFPQVLDPIPSTSTGITVENSQIHYIPTIYSSTSDSDIDNIREHLNTIEMRKLKNSDIDSEYSSPDKDSSVIKSPISNNKGSLKVFDGLFFGLSYAKYKRPPMNDSDQSFENDSLLNSDYYKADKLFKPQLETLIKKHGGTVFWYVNQIPKSHRKLSYLITDTPSQTCNFLLALAYGVPCYHHRYIEQAISQKIPFPEFLALNNIQPIPNGVSLEQNEIIFHSPNTVNQQIFSGYVIYLAFRQEDMNMFVSSLLRLCGAVVHTTWGKELCMPVLHYNTTIIVTDDHCPDVLARAKVPKLSIVWVIQSLICESPRPFDGHERYIAINNISDSEQPHTNDHI